MADIKAIAKDLEAQFAKGTWFEALIPHLADEVNVFHHPEAFPGDGPIAKDTLTATMRTHLGAILKDERQVLKSLTVEGDKITAVQDMVATLLNGKIFRIPLTQVFTFAGGRMVGLDHYPDVKASRDFLRALVDSGVPLPIREGVAP